MFPLPKTQETVKTVATWLHRAFDAVATWVTQLSWWKFLVFAILMLIAGSILQDELFSSNTVIQENVRSDKSKRRSGESNIVIDDSGIRFNPRNSKNRRSSSTADAASAVTDALGCGYSFITAPVITPSVPSAPIYRSRKS